MSDRRSPVRGFSVRRQPGFGAIAILCFMLLYLPIGGYALGTGWRELPPRTFGLAVLGGVAVHAVVAVIAFA